MKLKTAFAAFLCVIMLFSCFSIAYAEEGGLLKELSGQKLSTNAYIASDLSNGELFTVTYDYEKDNDKYVVTVYDAETAEPVKSMEKTITLDVITGCEVLSDGTYAVYDEYKGESRLYNSDLSFKGKGTCEKKPFDYDAKARENSLVSWRFLSEDGYARCSFENSFAEPTYAMAFYDETSCIYFTDDAEVNSYYGSYGKKLLASVKSNNKFKVCAGVYDYAAKTSVKVETPEFKGYTSNMLICGDIDETYAFFVVESDTGEYCRNTPYIWKYSEETEKTSFTSTKITAKTLKTYNNNYISELKKTYGINILVDKLPGTYPTYWDEEKQEEYGGVVKGANVFDTYLILKDLVGYLSYFPKNFTKEMAYFGGKRHDFDIYIDKEIKGAAAAFANRYDGFLICFATDEYCSDFIPHEFLHLIDARIDSYLEAKGKNYESEWDKLNPKGFFYYAEQDYNPKYFATSYAMSDSREDRADTFQYLFEAYSSSTAPYSYNAVKRKSIFLSQLIREAYPSVQSVDFATWEKWITPYPKKFKAKNTESSLKVYWSKCANASSYILQQKKDGVWTTVYSGTKKYYKLNELKSGKPYSFRVRALRLDGKRKVYSSYEYLDTATKPLIPVKFSVSTNSKHQLTAKWSKVKSCSGYQVQYAKDKSFKNKIATRETGKKAKKYVGKNFTKGRKYYVRVRSFTVSGDKKIYSQWSKVKKIKSR